MPQESTVAADATQPNLRQRTTRGILWVACQAVATRGATALQQLALGWLLAPDDFGLIGLTYTVTTFVNLLANPGIDTILVKRQRRFRLWATPAFWMGLTAGLGAMALMLAIAPLVSRLYAQPQLTGLVWILALAVPFQSLQVVPKAQLQFQMRFRAVALLGTMNNVLLAIFTVGAAYFGMGVYSFVVPVPIVAALMAAAQWKIARPPVRMRAEVDRWRYLLGTSLTLLATQLLFVFDNQADYMSLGLAQLSEPAIGAYVFAFGVAVQALRLLSGSVMTVLFPGLSHLSHDPDKQTRAALRAMRLLVLVSVPFCLLQAVMTPPAFRLLQLVPKWEDAILPCQILTIGLMINAVCWPAASLFNAQGRFRMQFWVSLATSLLLAAMLIAALWYRRSILSVAYGVAVWNCVHTMAFHSAAFWKRAPRGSFFREIGPPLFAGVTALGPCGALQWYLPGSILGDLIVLFGGSALFAVIYLFAVRAIAPASVDDLIQQLLPLWHRLRGVPATAADAAILETAKAAVSTDGDKLP